MLGEHLTPHDEAAQRLPSTHDVEKRHWGSRVRTSMSVSVKPANASDRHQTPIEGRCRDLSDTGCGLFSDFAPRVGDCYLLEFAYPESLEPRSVYGRCVRCHWLGESAFESGFAFLSPSERFPTQEHSVEPDSLI